MEHTNLKIKIKDWIFKIVAIAILVFIGSSLIQIREMVKEHYEAFDENPLLFGAKKYEITECSCYANGKNFKFNQEKIWKEENKNSFYPDNFSFNSSSWGNLIS